MSTRTIFQLDAKLRNDSIPILDIVEKYVTEFPILNKMCWNNVEE